MSFRGGGLKKRKRKRKRKGGALIGADPRTWAPRGGAMRPWRVGVRAGMAAYQGARALARKRGSGMGFSGAGMAWSGAGLRSGRLFLRRGMGRRVI